MLLDEKLGLNPMQSKANEVLNSENMMVFLLIMKKKKNQITFLFYVLFRWLRILYWKIDETVDSNFYLE